MLNDTLAYAAARRDDQPAAQPQHALAGRVGEVLDRYRGDLHPTHHHAREPATRGRANSATNVQPIPVTLSYVRQQDNRQEVMQQIFSLVPLEAPLRGFRLRRRVGHQLGSRPRARLLPPCRKPAISRSTFQSSTSSTAPDCTRSSVYAGSLNGAGGEPFLANPTALTERVFDIARLAEHPRIVIEATSGE